LAEANDYEIAYMWLTPTHEEAFPDGDVRYFGHELVAPGSPADSDRPSFPTPATLKWYVLNVVYRNTTEAAFRLGLDTQVHQSELDQNTVAGKYWKAVQTIPASFRE
jgi:hypothetical protein